MYPPQSFGGYEHVWRSAMLELERRGHEVRVLTSDLDFGQPGADDPHVRRELRLYWVPHRLPPMSPLAKLRVERHNARVLRRHVTEFRPDVISWWAMGGTSLSLIERVRRAGIPAVAFVHDDWLDYGRDQDGWHRAWRAGRFRRLAPLAQALTRVPTRVDFAHAARYVFVSETTRRRAAAAGVDPPAVSIAHSGIDPGFIDPAPERDWDWSLLYVGRIDERKGVHTAVEALALLPEATLTIVGGWDEAEEERLRATADRAGVTDRVRFRGHLPLSEVRAAYVDADAVVFPVIWEEPWGLVPIEAMARGRPVVATGRGGSGEYLRDGENALLFEAGDAEALAAAVRRLRGDPQLRRRLNATGLETARRHTETHFNSRVVEELEAAYDAAHGSPRSRATS